MEKSPAVTVVLLGKTIPASIDDPTPRASFYLLISSYRRQLRRVNPKEQLPIPRSPTLSLGVAMTGPEGSTEVLRFEIEVNGEAYRSLVAGLRGQHAACVPPRPARGPVRALIDLDLHSQSFSVARIGRHKLPRALSIRSGSSTHKNLAAILSKALGDASDTTLHSLMHHLIEASSNVSSDLLRVNQRDLELLPKDVFGHEGQYSARHFLTTLAPTVLLDIDETPVPIVREPPSTDLARAVNLLKRMLRVILPPHAHVAGNFVEIHSCIAVPSPKDLTIDIFAHWGSYEELSPPWQDEHVLAIDSDAPSETSSLYFRTHVPAHGWYGATFFAQIRGSSDRIWLGQGPADDASFFIAHDDAIFFRTQQERFCATLEFSHEIGEVVFASPEGPHAAAGGLGQVISSLPPELCKAGIPLSIITPLYRYANGNKHEAAEAILEDGVNLGEMRVTPTYIGSIAVQLGPSLYSGTSWHKRPPSNLPIKVYLAQHGRLRLFLLSNTALFDRLYQPVYGDEQIRRAIAFSRAILETIATEHFGIRPSVIISNDWMTACVPAFAALDERYKQVSWIRSSKTLHMIHNGGADYHGRLPVHVHGEDLWPMFNLAPQHYFGFQDPHQADLMNFTMAAAHHTTGGVLTVSKPYARQLISPNGGDGLEHVLKSRRDSVFGISNGINRSQIDSFLAIVGGCSVNELRDAASLLDAKTQVKTTLQQRYGLTARHDATVASFVGRIAEQKGPPLLSGFINDAPRSTLEDLLYTHPKLQIIVAGPLTAGDRTADDLRNCLSFLSHRFPGRVAGVFEYIPHTTALEIIFGSTLFLMPSRFEPGGITQLEALAAGTPVVGRNVGGISATVENYNEVTGCGNGFLCNDYTPTAFARTMHWALKTIGSERTHMNLVTNAINARHAWSDRVPEFLNLLRRVVAVSAAPGLLSAAPGLLSAVSP